MNWQTTANQTYWKCEIRIKISMKVSVRETLFLEVIFKAPSGELLGSGCNFGRMLNRILHPAGETVVKWILNKWRHKALINAIINGWLLWMGRKASLGDISHLNQVEKLLLQHSWLHYKHVTAHFGAFPPEVSWCQCDSGNLKTHWCIGANN